MKRLDTQLNSPSNQNLIKVQSICKVIQRMGMFYFKYDYERHDNYFHLGIFTSNNGSIYYDQSFNLLFESIYYSFFLFCVDLV